MLSKYSVHTYSVEGDMVPRDKDRGNALVLRTVTDKGKRVRNRV